MRYFTNSTETLIITFLIAVIAGIFSYRARFLTSGGSVIAALLAAALYGYGGLKWLLPMLVFFILSSLLSKFRKQINPDVEKFFEKSGTRDFKQVLANGGIGIILVLLNYFLNSEKIYLSYIGLLSVVCADTWATETGTMMHVKTYNVITLKKAVQGESGGISWLGFMGSVLGSLFIALSSIFWMKCNLIQFFSIVIFTGLIGNIIDSILGALLQAQFKCNVCGLITEKRFHCNTHTLNYHGINWLDNDLVNLISGFSGCLIILVFQYLI